MVTIQWTVKQIRNIFQINGCLQHSDILQLNTYFEHWNIVHRKGFLPTNILITSYYSQVIIMFTVLMLVVVDLNKWPYI